VLCNLEKRVRKEKERKEKWIHKVYLLTISDAFCQADLIKMSSRQRISVWMWTEST
jgi:hypothetical protein